MWEGRLGLNPGSNVTVEEEPPGEAREGPGGGEISEDLLEEMKAPDDDMH